MLTQARHVVREEISSPERTKLMIRISDRECQTKVEVVKRLNGKALAISVNMVNFIPNQLLASINQPSRLIGDVFVEEVE